MILSVLDISKSKLAMPFCNIFKGLQRGNLLCIVINYGRKVGIGFALEPVYKLMHYLFKYASFSSRHKYDMRTKEAILVVFCRQ